MGPDCTQRQVLHIDNFAQNMKSHEIDVLQVNVQLQRDDFISEEHEQITSQFGGPGYPRTVLIQCGKVADQNNIEIITEASLSALAEKFIKVIAE